MKKFRLRHWLIIVCISITYADYLVHQYKASDNYIRDRVMLLTNGSESCTGIQVKAPSGNVYILSAAHCVDIFSSGEGKAVDENGKETIVNIIDIDVNHDLLLLNSVSKKSINVAKKLTDKHQHVHTITHGRAYPSYRTDGELLMETITNITLFEIESQEEYDKCHDIGGEVIGRDYKDMMFSTSEYCSKKYELYDTTAAIVGGSSGGPFLNDSGELIGIASASDNVFSRMVSLHNIHDFLRNR